MFSLACTWGSRTDKEHDAVAGLLSHSTAERYNGLAADARRCTCKCTASMCHEPNAVGFANAHLPNRGAQKLKPHSCCHTLQRPKNTCMKCRTSTVSVNLADAVSSASLMASMGPSGASLPGTCGRQAAELGLEGRARAHTWPPLHRPGRRLRRRGRREHPSCMDAQRVFHGSAAAAHLAQLRAKAARRLPPPGRRRLHCCCWAGGRQACQRLRLQRRHIHGCCAERREPRLLLLHAGAAAPGGRRCPEGLHLHARHAAGRHLVKLVVQCGWLGAALVEAGQPMPSLACMQCTWQSKRSPTRPSCPESHDRLFAAARSPQPGARTFLVAAPLVHLQLHPPRHVNHALHMN